jgi:hypothetical protein
MLRVLKKGSVISTALPTDLGLQWRLGRFFIKNFIQKKTHNLNNLDYDYVNAIEHINSIFNFGCVDLNLFYVVQILKK